MFKYNLKKYQIAVGQIRNKTNKPLIGNLKNVKSVPTKTMVVHCVFIHQTESYNFVIRI